MDIENLEKNFKRIIELRSLIKSLQMQIDIILDEIDLK